MADSALLLETGDYLLLEDGSSHLLLEVEAATSRGGIDLPSGGRARAPKRKQFFRQGEVYGWVDRIEDAVEAISKRPTKAKLKRVREIIQTAPDANIDPIVAEYVQTAQGVLDAYEGEQGTIAQRNRSAAEAAADAIEAFRAAMLLYEEQQARIKKRRNDEAIIALLLS